MQRLFRLGFLLLLPLSLSGCNNFDLNRLMKSSLSSLGATKEDSSIEIKSTEGQEKNVASLGSIVSEAQAGEKVADNFSDSLKLAVGSDPRVLSARQDYEARLASLKSVMGDKDFQVSSSVYGGIEDVTDETAGVALVLSARRMIYDGGILESTISAEKLFSKMAYQNILVNINESALESASAWVELERYMSLNELIRSRLEVLEPLIAQLEQVAKAGVGDKTQVAAAQRTVTMIRVTESNVAERLELAKVNFKNIFGNLPSDVRYDSKLISEALPTKISQSVILASPGLVGGYEAYKAAIFGLEAVKASADFSVGFETKIQRPFGGSGYDSDEAVGLVLRKTLYDGKKLDAEIERSEREVDSRVAKLQTAYREVRRLVETGQQTIISLDAAMNIANDNASASLEEIEFLRKQLVIGQSTLDSVLAAEARLYDAESREIELLADQRIAELSILATLGLLGPLFGL